MTTYETISLSLLESLDHRTKSIVVQRFGLEGGEPATLEAIGQTHGITRERVRQIVEEGVRAIQENAQDSKRFSIGSVFQNVKKALAKHGYIKREDLFLQHIEAGREASHLLFLMHLGEGFWRQRETQTTHAFWVAHEDFARNAIPQALGRLAAEIEKAGRPVDERDLLGFGAFSDIPLRKPAEKSILSVLEVSKLLMKGYDGRWGMKFWPEVNPRGVREKAYIVLKNEGMPLHFRSITERIAELQKKLPYAPEKPILSQTVHNELIKDSRFVLVGRGTYALAEWGYVQGTVKDVLVEILKKHKKGLTKDDLLLRVLEQRQVKDSTVILSLQDKTLFERNVGGRYGLKQ